MKITQKGQVTIPMEIRERHDFLPDTNIEFREEGDKVYVVKSEVDIIKESPFDKVKGIYNLKLSTEEIMKLTRNND